MVVLLLDPHVEDGEKSGFSLSASGGDFFSWHFYVYVCIHVFPHIGIFGQKFLPPVFFLTSRVGIQKLGTKKWGVGTRIHNDTRLEVGGKPASGKRRRTSTPPPLLSPMKGKKSRLNAVYISVCVCCTSHIPPFAFSLASLAPSLRSTLPNWLGSLTKVVTSSTDFTANEEL